MNDPLKPQEFLGYLMSTAMKGIGTRLLENFKKAGYPISKPEWFVMIRCFHFDKQEMLQSELVDMLMGDKTAVTRAVDELVKKGWLHREIYENDRRNRVLSLSEEGKKQVPNLLTCARNTIAEVTEGISESEMEIVKKALKCIIENSNKLNQ